MEVVESYRFQSSWAEAMEAMEGILWFIVKLEPTTATVTEFTAAATHTEDAINYELRSMNK